MPTRTGLNLPRRTWDCKGFRGFVQQSEQCREIQDGWPDEEQRKRAAWSYEREEVEFPQAKAAAFVKVVDNT